MVKKIPQILQRKEGKSAETNLLVAQRVAAMWLNGKA